MKGRELLEKMDMVSPVYVEEADRIPIIRVKRWPKVAVAAACLCLVAWGAWGLSGGFGREPGIVAGPGASDAPEVSEMPEVSIPPSEPPAPDDSEAMAAYRDVLAGDAGFTYTSGLDGTREVNIADIKGIYNPELPDTYVVSMDFSVLDLDGDGESEVVLWVDRNSAVGCSVALHYQDGVVYGFLFYTRSFGNVKTDGTFWFSSSAADHGFGRLVFASPGSCTVDRITFSESGESGADMTYVVDHQPATQAEFDAAVSEFYDKEAPVWYELTEENIAAVFTAGEPSDTASIAPEPCPDTLGFTQCEMCWKKEPEGFTHWWYCTREDGQYRFIAYTFGPGDEPEVYRVDLDGDGVDELVCNVEWTDGTRQVLVYRSRDGVIEQGRLEIGGWMEAWAEEDLLVIYGTWDHTSYYDPERGFVMEIVLGDKNGEDVLRTETFRGLEHFEFETFEIHDGDPLTPSTG